jgi:hypothetical protein
MAGKNMDAWMIVYTLVLVLLLPFAFICSTPEGIFSRDELIDMGIFLENLPVSAPA